MKRSAGILSALALSAACCLGTARGATIVVPAGGTLALGASPTDALNAETTVVELKAGATLVMTNAAAGAWSNRLAAQIVATNGVANLDLSGLSDGTFRLLSGILCGTTGGLVVKGRDTVLFGRSMNPTTDINFPLFDAPSFAFETAGGDGLVFVDCLTLRRAPAAYSVSAGATLALRGTNPLSGHSAWNAAAGAHGTLTLADFDILPLEPASLPAGATVTVGNGRTVYAKPCSVSPNNVFGWVGCRGTNRLDLVLNAGGTFNILSVNDYVLEGSVTGAGRIIKHTAMGKGAGAGTAGALVKGALGGFTGEIAVSGPGSDTTFADLLLRFSDFGTGVSLSSVKYGTAGRATVSFEGTGTVAIASLSGPDAPAANILSASAGLTLGVTSLSGAVTLAGAGTFDVSAVEPQAVVGVRGRAKTAFGTFGFGSRILAEAESGVDSVVFENMSALPFIDASAPVTVTVPDGCALAGVADGVTLRIGSGASAVGSAFASTGAFDLRGGMLTLDGAFGETNATQVLLWLDASKASSFQSLTNNGAAVTFTNDFRLVDEWHDCRAGQTAVYARNNRAKLAADPTVYARLYPYVVPGGCDGKDYVSMGRLGVSTRDGTENRRFNLWQGAPDVTLAEARFVIMVFGSQNGGGAAIVSDKEDSFRRRAALQFPVVKPESAASGNDLWLDGVKTNAATALLSGGWQVVSVDLGSAGLYALGQPGTVTTDAGGQNYAEVIVLSEVPTAACRVAIEKYLAAKWGLSARYRDCGVRPAARLSGTGRVTLASDLELSGTFRGTVDLNGRALRVSALPQPPTAADVPADGRVFWFDPELEGALHHATANRPLAVSTLYGRNNAGLAKAASDYCLVGTYANSSLDRRPWVSRSARGSGPVRNWLDFTDIYPGDTLRNALRLQKVGTSDDQKVTYRSGFYVLDSTQGGGSLLLSDIQGNSGIVHRDGADAASPIWSGTNVGQGVCLNEGVSYLDGTAVDGASHGFSGRPEVLSFAASKDMSNLPLYMGYINATPNREVIGETMFFNRVLSDAERQTVEAYLMNKWLGIVPSGYSDLSGTTLTGDGSVICASHAALPKFDAGFTGSLSLSATAYDFSVDAAATPAVTGAIRTPNGRVALPANATMRVDFTTKAKGGRYVLVSAAAIEGAGNLQLQTSGLTRDLRMNLSVSATEIALDVIPNGLIFIFR